MTDTGMATVDTSTAEQTLAQLLDARISCRAYLPTQVPRDVIERILALAQQTPSWCNTQPWQVAITEGEGTERFRAGLAQYVRTHPQESDFDFPREYTGAHKRRRRECAMQLYASVGIAAGDRAASAEQTMKNFDLFGAPHVAIVTTHEALGTYGAVDCGLYVDTFLLAAQSLGVATIPQAALAGSSRFIHEFFGLEEDRRVVCAISFGYPDAENPVNGFRTDRESVADVAQWVSE
ncbi:MULTISPECIES: nitroreductase [unclassified Rhodococcus (in: high G+C Gram-positive bacteria)]|uniref:nitroreductase n=1 Tax=unclassified Rhodococcus (in: high G+C Gram-positive bacteria) TaxID=192944 RepID=UPI00163AE7F8|nr:MULTISPECIES: nitroreductase [unclassified Rhodococcus (in: high G+C Gram-positive bacteria)]MBC2643066.1 nitroreductase [Rhodococcus sp. 3A]MBC2892193.1 nitroreductase [Rhodococcus sp. 4CII]